VTSASRLAVVFAAAAALGACQCASLKDALFLCAEDGSCGEGTICGVEGYCVPIDGGAGGQGGAGGGGKGGGGGAASELTFLPSDDASIYHDLPDTNFGADSTLETDLDAVKDFLLRFPVTGLGARTVAGARLVLRCEDSASDSGGTVHLSSGAWAESTVTWNTAPAAGSALFTLPQVDTGKSYEIPLTGVVTGEGIYEFRVSSTDTDGADYASKEGADSPRLIVTVW
jgi:hypothetical protein